MRHFLLILILGLFSVSAFAEVLVPKEAIPENILTNFSKKHPNATDVVAQPKTHFGQDLYLITFKEAKETDQKSIVYYRVNGNIYVNGSLIDIGVNSVRMPQTIYDSLKVDFSNYEIKEAFLIINPNAHGEEYDLVISASGATWYITLDENGKIIKKEQ